LPRLIGTAGHVDHGKTSLIQALTGIDADRLPEEKRREMTIDVGFAFLDLPDLGRVSVVDVPGHERFLSNMLVGAQGMDVVLLCVAADEGVKPQTREHLQILELLPVESLILVFTRSDLADKDQRQFAELETREMLQPTRFKDVPAVFVSSKTKDGIGDLIKLISDVLRRPAQVVDGPWYLPIDRVFTVAGHGCVVTGTLARGTMRSGDSAVIVPGDLSVRIREIQSHGEPVSVLRDGQRTAVNLGGVKAEDLARGQALAAPGSVFESSCFDAKMTWKTPVKSGQEVRISIGSAECVGRLTLGKGSIDQFRLAEPVAVALDQALIVRRLSPEEVLGGGRVKVPQAIPRRVSEEKEAGDSAAPVNPILNVLKDRPEGVTTTEVCRQLGRSPQELGGEFERLLREESLRGFAGLWFSIQAFDTSKARFLAALAKLHERFPQVAGHQKEAIVREAGLTWSDKSLDRIVASMVEDKVIASDSGILRLPEFRVALTDRQRQLLERVRIALESVPVNTPSAMDLARELAIPVQAIEEIIKLGVRSGELVSLEGGVFYTTEQIEKIKEMIREISHGKPFPAYLVRDRLQTSRKYVIPLLEHLDKVKFTLRTGDLRSIK
jgi:selenocysteine-specific elongation factor